MIAHSVSPAGKEIATLQLRYWRAIHGEFMTHRVFSRNASSSRAIPVKKMLAQVWNDPAGPLHWGVNRPGMQAKEELAGFKLYLGKWLWRTSGKAACGFAWVMMKLGMHKQVANRILEPWQYINVVVTSTEWANFFALRCDPDAQPEIQELAVKMKNALDASVPKQIRYGQYHLPYGNPDHPEHMNLITSAARCARTSYLTHAGGVSNYEADEKLFEQLVGSTPIHASPTEHQATPLPLGERDVSNFRGWKQHRQEIESAIAA